MIDSKINTLHIMKCIIENNIKIFICILIYAIIFYDYMYLKCNSEGLNNQFLDNIFFEIHSFTYGYSVIILLITVYFYQQLEKNEIKIKYKTYKKFNYEKKKIILIANFLANNILSIVYLELCFFGNIMFSMRHFFLDYIKLNIYTFVIVFMELSLIWISKKNLILSSILLLIILSVAVLAYHNLKVEIWNYTLQGNILKFDVVYWAIMVIGVLITEKGLCKLKQGE